MKEAEHFNSVRNLWKKLLYSIVLYRAAEGGESSRGSASSFVTVLSIILQRKSTVGTKTTGAEAGVRAIFLRPLLCLLQN